MPYDDIPEVDPLEDEPPPIYECNDREACDGRWQRTVAILQRKPPV